MPKRANPFSPSASVQYKSHIGVKEVNMGVNRQELMQQVYERTLSTMFSAARTETATHDGYRVNASHHALEWPRNNDMAKCASENAICHAHKGQLAFDSKGRLSRGSVVTAKSSSGHHHMEAVQSLSDTCSKCGSAWSCASSDNTCAYCCMANLCDTCLRLCLACGGVFCRGCSMSNYEEANERFVCYNCLR